MNVTDALLDSWNRQCRIVNAVAGLINETNQSAKPSPDGFPLIEQLAHMHQVRRYWLSQLDAVRAKSLASSYSSGWQNPIKDLAALRSMLAESGTAVGQAVRAAIDGGRAKVGGYDNPVLFLQHMVWHDGWHIGLIFLALRLAGQEPPDEWEEQHVWGQWRAEDW